MTTGVTATVQTVVNAMYVTMYGRAADSTGYAYWAGVPMWGTSGSTACTTETLQTTTVATNTQAQTLGLHFKSSQSTYFNTTYASLDANAFIRALYVNLGGNSDVGASDLLYWTSQLATLGGDRGKLAGEFVHQFLTINLSDSTDAAAVGRQQTFLNKVLVSEDWVTQSLNKSFMQAVSANDAAFNSEHTILLGITSANATVAAATSQIESARAASSLSPITGQSVVACALNLTTASDELHGSSGNDTFSAAFGSVQGADELHGSAGTDTFAARLDTGAGSPSISGVEIFSLNSRNHSATFDFTNVAGATAIVVEGLGLTLSAAPMGVPVSINNGYSSILTVAVTNTSTAETTLTLDVNSAQSATIRASGVDILTINANGTTASLSSASDFRGASALILGGAGAFSLNLYSSNAGGLSADAFSGLSAISTTGAGAFIIDAGNVSQAMSIIGGPGNDTVYFHGEFNNADSVQLGAGTNTLGFTVNTAMDLVGNISGVNTLIADLNASVTAALTANTGISTLVLRQQSASTAVFSGVASGLKTINIESGGGTATISSNLILNYSAASDVVVSLSPGTATALETASQTATAIGFGTIGIFGNSGAINFNVVGTASVKVYGLLLTGQKSVTLSAGTMGLTLETANSATANYGGSAQNSAGIAAKFDTATTLNLVANSGMTLDVKAVLWDNAVVTATLNAAGASALVDVSALLLDNGKVINLNANAAGSGALMVTADQIQFSATNTASAHVAGSAFDLTSIGFNALGGDISVGEIKFVASADVSSVLRVTMTAQMGNTANLVTIGELSAAVGTSTININLAGSGSFILNSAHIATGALNVNMTGLSSASTALIGATALNGSSVLTVTFGINNGNAYGGSGADTFIFGNGSQTAAGNGGNDDWYMSATAANFIKVTVATAAGTGTAATAMGTDRVFNITTGDTIVAEAASTVYTALTGTSITTAGSASFSAGGILNASWTAASTAALCAGTSIANPFAIFTASGNIVIQVLLTTASLNQNTGFNSSNFAEYLLEGKDLTAAVSAQFSLNYNTTASGLALTLIA